MWAENKATLKSHDTNVGYAESMLSAARSGESRLEGSNTAAGTEVELPLARQGVGD